MRFQSFKRIFGDRGAAAKPTRPARGKRKAGLELESLEQRNLMATIPAVAVSGVTDLTSFFPNNLTPQASTPAIAVDPVNPQKLVAVYVDHISNANRFQKYAV